MTQRSPKPLRSVDGPVPAPPDDALRHYDFSQQVGHLLRRAYQRHVAIFQQGIPDSQLTAAQFVVLCAVHEHGPSSLNDVVRATAIDQGTARGVVDRLKARGLLEVSHDPADRRKVVIRATGTGEALVRQMVPFAAGITEATFGDMNPAERVAMLFLLQKMSGPGEGAAAVD
ncbi:winged helix DNA-binding protein [Xylophilus sp. Kf1]|nr:winged helix DNA-binding protein [Xylophilus sp. Kf1]